MSNQAFKLARRFSAAMSPEKLEVLLQKIRKSEGKTTTLSWGNLGDVFAVLDPGWKLEKSISIVKLYGRHNNSDKPEIFHGQSEEEAQKRQRELAKDAVTSLPATPKANQLYVLELTEVIPSPHLTGMFEFSCKPWMGVESWKLTSSNGKTTEARPGTYATGELQHGYKKPTRGKIPTYETLPWLNKETDWLAQIDKKLGLDTFEKSVPRTRDKTGSCPVCFQNIKITESDQKIVLHGYKRPGTGQAHGSCFGVGYKAFEVGVAGTRDYLKQVVSPAAMEKAAYVKSLSDGHVTKIVLWNKKEVTPADSLWGVYLKQEIEKSERDSDYTTKLEAVYTKLVSNWKERPLPKEGEKHIDWFFKGQEG